MNDKVTVVHTNGDRKELQVVARKNGRVSCVLWPQLGGVDVDAQGWVMKGRKRTLWRLEEKDAASSDQQLEGAVSVSSTIEGVTGKDSQ
jgi:hypothetical protein